MASLLDKIWPTQTGNASSSNLKYKSINGKPNDQVVSQDDQSTYRPEVSSTYQGNYIRPIEARAPLKMPTKSAPVKPSKKMMTQSRASKSSKTSSSSAAKEAKKALKNFEVLKASAKPVAPIPPMARRSTPLEALTSPIAPSMREIQSPLLSPGPIANSKKRMSPGGSMARPTPTGLDKLSPRHTVQVPEEQEQAPRYDEVGNVIMDDVASQSLFVSERGSSERGPNEEAFETNSNYAQHEDLDEQGLQEEARIRSTREKDPTRQEYQEEVLETAANIAQERSREETHTLENDRESEPDESNENGGSEEEYEVENILDHKYTNRKLFLYLKWKGYDDGENTWEPEENLADTATEILQAYFDTIGGRPKNISQPRRRLSQKPVASPAESDEYLVLSSRIETPEPWSPVPPQKGNWDEHVFRVNHISRVGEQILVGIIWIVEDQNGNRYQTQQEYGAVHEAAPMALLRYYEDNVRFEDTPEKGIPMHARSTHPFESNIQDESRSRKRSLRESSSFATLPTRQKKAK